MNLESLRCHPDGTPPDGLAVAVAIRRTDDGGLRLDYRLTRAFVNLLLPATTTPARTDELWRHTCCEAFIAPAGGSTYREFNFSPSNCWAIYDFADYRQASALPPIDTPPRIACRRDGDDLWLCAELPATLLPVGAARLGLTVVAETPAGDKSYWALAHAGERPDFHLAASFTLPLP